MSDIVQYRSILQSNSSRYGSVDGTSPDLSSDQGVADVIREEMVNTYGWQSPSEYYYGSSNTEMSGKPSESMLSLGEIQRFYDLGELGDGGPADKSVIPDWFWVDSLDNWCYFKITDDMTEFKKTTPRFGKYGNLVVQMLGGGIVNVIDDIQKGNWWKGILDGLKTITMISPVETSVEITAESNDDIARVTGKINRIMFGDTIIGNALTALSYEALFVPAKMLATASTIEGLMTLPTMLYSMFSVFTSLDHEDVEAEPYPEEQASGNKKNNMPRNCISMYMWNGYKRNWMPMKSMLELYERYGKLSSKDLLVSSLELIAQRMRSESEEKFVIDLQLYGIIVEAHDDTLSAVRDAALEIKRSSSTDYEFISKMTDLLILYPQCVNALSRMLFMNMYGFDPRCIESMQKRALLNKKQILRVDNGDSGTWSKEHYLENWSMWMALPRDRGKIKLYNKNTYQLINRPYQYMYYAKRDLGGFEHKNIGHPCFMRGNDDLLWVCYWQRWTSSRGKEEEEGSVLDKTITVGGIQDIFKDDVDNWKAVRDSMFEKHDDYGFDDWMINGNYLLSNHRFTIDEESPTSISTYEESTIAPDRVAPVNSIDECDGGSMVLRLSSGTVVSRDDDNGVIDVAKRWR